MDVYDMIKNDNEIIEIYNTIYENTNTDDEWAHHDLQHVNNVTNLVESLLSQLGYDNEFISEAKIAALLHDVGALQGKKEHNIRSYNFAKDYFKRKNIKLKNEELVLEAIKIHSAGFDTDNIIALALILSDKLDIKYTRMAPGGYKVIGMRQIQYIKDVQIKLSNNNLFVNIICDENIDKEELEEYYFIIKVFKAIIAFSKKINLEPIVKFNNNDWLAFKEVKKNI